MSDKNISLDIPVALNEVSMITEYRAEYKHANGKWTACDHENNRGWVTDYRNASDRADDFAKSGSETRVTRRTYTIEVVD